MARLTIQLPSLLRHLLDGDRSVEVEGETLREALDDLCRRHPTLEVHLFDESGSLREHVLCIHGDRHLRRRDDLDRPVAGGDEVRIHQAVSGG